MDTKKRWKFPTKNEEKKREGRKRRNLAFEKGRTTIISLCYCWLSLIALMHDQDEKGRRKQCYICHATKVLLPRR